MKMDENHNIYEKVSVINRFACYLVDFFIMFGIVSIIDLFIVLNNLTKGIIIYMFLGIYFIISESKFKTTIGKRFGNLYVLDEREEKRISLYQAISRVFMFAISTFILDIGNIMAIFDKKNRTLHDMVTKTKVIYYGKKSKPSKIDIKKIIILLILLLLGLFLLGIFLKIWYKL